MIESKLEEAIKAERKIKRQVINEIMKRAECVFHKSGFNLRIAHFKNHAVRKLGKWNTYEGITEDRCYIGDSYGGGMVTTPLTTLTLSELKCVLKDLDDFTLWWFHS